MSKVILIQTQDKNLTGPIGASYVSTGLDLANSYSC